MRQYPHNENADNALRLWAVTNARANVLSVFLSLGNENAFIMRNATNEGAWVTGVLAVHYTSLFLYFVADVINVLMGIVSGSSLVPCKDLCSTDDPPLAHGRQS